MRIRYLLVLAAVVLLAAACTTKGMPAVAAPAATTEPPPSSASTPDLLTCSTAEGETKAIAESKLYIEYNATDGDLGVHGSFGDDGWSELCVYAPDGTLMLALKPQSQLKDLAMATIFFESREPPLDEFGFDDLKARFPEGQYEVRGTGLDGAVLTGAATFSHDTPAPPTITYPELAEEEQSAPSMMSTCLLTATAWACPPGSSNRTRCTNSRSSRWKRAVTRRSRLALSRQKRCKF